MATLRDHGMTEGSLNNTVTPETLDETVTAMVRYPDGTVFETDDGQLIFAPDNAPAFWSADEPNLEDVLAGEVVGWEPDEETKVTRF